MAKDDSQSNIGLANEVDDSSSSVSNLPSNEPVEQKFTPTAGKPLLIQFNAPIKGIGAIISNVTVNNLPISGFSADIKAGDFITLVGRGLNVFDKDEWKLQRQGKSPVNLPIINSAENGKWVTLRVPVRASSGLEINESLGLSFFSSKYGGRVRMLPIVLVYESQDQAPTAEQTVSQVSPKTGLVNQPIAKPTESKTATAQQGALGVIAEFINQNPEVFKDLKVRELLLKAVGIGDWQKISPGDQKSLLEGLAQVNLLNKLPKPVKTAIEDIVKIPLESIQLKSKSAGAVQSQKKPDQTEVNEADNDDEVGTEALDNQTADGETQADLQSSLELVNRYIAENPLAISDIKTKQNIQTALKTGDLSSLNGTEHIVLQAVANNIGLKSTGSLKTASQVVRNASVQQVANKQPASASVKVSQTVSGQTGGVDVSQAQNTVDVNVQSQTGTVGDSSEAKVSQTSEAAIAVNQKHRAQEIPTATGLGGGEIEESIKIDNQVTSDPSSNVPQSELEILVEYLKDNNLIPETLGSESQLLATLANTEGKNLPGTDPQKLLEVLKQVSLEPTAPKRVKDSANQVLKQITAQKTQSGVNPIKPQSNQSKTGVGSKPSGKVKPKADAEAKLAQMRKREAQLLAKGSLPSVSGKIIQPVSQGESLDATASVESKVSVVKKDTSQAVSSETAPVAMPSAGIMPKSSALGKNIIDDLPLVDSNSLTETLPIASGSQPSDLPKDQTRSIPPVPQPTVSSAGATPESDDANEQDKLTPLERQELERQRQSEETLQKAREILASRQQGAKSLSEREAETIINKEVDVILNRLAWLVWGGAFPSFGLSILIGAILGDIIWLLGPRVIMSSGKIVSWLMNKMPVKSPLNKASDLVAKIQPKLSAKVKLQILLMNLIVLIILFLIIVIIIAVLYDICSSKLNYLSADAYNLNEYCASIKTLVEGAGQ
jgi:hypothetical protein